MKESPKVINRTDSAFVKKTIYDEDEYVRTISYLLSTNDSSRLSLDYHVLCAP